MGVASGTSIVGTTASEGHTAAVGSLPCDEVMALGHYEP